MYQRRILQIIWHIQDALAPFERLFRGIYQQSYISLGQHRVNSSSLLKAGNWDRTKSDHIVTRGFALTEGKPLNIEHQFVFRDYTGSREIDSNLVLSISWKLTGESLSQSVAIDQEEIAELAESIPYSELQDGVIDRDLFVAKVMTHVMRRIVNLSEGAEKTKG